MFKNITTKNKKILAVILIAFLIILVPNWFMPFVSDDSFYYLIPGDQGFIANLINTSVDHYLTWSGRLLTDVESRLMLQLPFFMRAILKSAILISLLSMIAILPNLILKRNTSKQFIPTFVALFVIYWVCNPNLGQTTFWNVGSSNYLFTNFWIVLYLTLAFYLFNKQSSVLKSLPLMLIAFAAGLSNENTAPVIVLFSLAMIVFAYYKKRYISYPWLFGLFGNLAGAAILILSPGSKARLSTSPDFVEESLSLKVYNFISGGTYTYTFENYGFLFLIFVTLLLVKLIQSKYDKKYLFLAAIFFLMAIIANAAFVMSPELPIRSLQGAFVFFLISFVFLLHDCLSYISSKYDKSSILILFSAVTILFTVSYALMVHSIYLANKESQIRAQAVLTARSKKADTVNIPSWYVSSLLRPNNDPFDRFFNPKFGAFYDYSGNVREISTPFNYTDVKKLKAQQYAINSKYVNKINIFNNGEKFGNQTMVIFIKDKAPLNFKTKVLLYTQAGVKEFNPQSTDSVTVHGYRFISVELGNYVYKNPINKITVENNLQ